jgi:predicted component of type VI protein secretion system
MALLRRKKEHGEPSLVVIVLDGDEGTGPLRRFPLGPGADVVGRDESCSIQVVDGQVSRQHLSICFDSRMGGFLASDMDSRNGTFVNGEQLEQPAVLQEGDVVQIGNSRLLYTTRDADRAMRDLMNLKRHGEHYKGTLAGDD